ncbi:MAG: MFS transporter [Dehalococcoidia bacterium]|nr:MFS transporter [Dehalococcoidia bacterium]
MRALNPRRVFYGWWIVAITLFLTGIAFGPLLYGAGIMMVALKRDFNWSQSFLSLPWTLNRAVEGALLGPIDGWLTNILGPRRMVIIGILILGAGLIGFSLIETQWGYLIAVATLWLGANMALGIPLTTAMNNWFIRRRTIAMALGQMGGNLGGFLVPLLAASIEAFGWRTTTLWAGIGITAIAIPIGMAVRNSPEQYGLRPDGDPPLNPQENRADGQATTVLPHPQTAEVDFTATQAMKTWSFWLLSLSMGCAVAAALTVILYIVPALEHQGISLAIASTVVTVYTFTSVAARLVAGFLGDRYSKQHGIAIFVAIQALGVLAAALIPGLLGAFLFAILFGIGFGGRGPLYVAIRGDYFGRKNFATIVGVSSLVPNLTFAIPIAVGWWYDRVGDYTLPFLLLGVINMVGAFLILWAKPPKPPVPSRKEPSPVG